MRVALTTSRRAEGKDTELGSLSSALARHGLTCASPVWDDSRVDWSAFDVVVVRSTWDYPDRPREFLDWARRVHGETLLLNQLDAIEWNLDKRYLRCLADAGVPVVPTVWTSPGERWEPLAGNEYVVKPAVSNAARNTARYRPGRDDRRAAAHVGRLHQAGRVVMTQPYQNAVDHNGELSLIYLDGRYSHAVRKSALLKSGDSLRDDLFFQAHIEVDEPSDAEFECARRAIDAVIELHGVQLYARIDLIIGLTGEPVVLECELVEPFLFIDLIPRGAEMMADAIVGQVDRLASRRRLSVRPDGRTAAICPTLLR
ncbi:RimK family alpha-L-glutamate ligase [Amycolatopsis sp. NPDC059021]|uniref:ATP-grasp domain-containing protein n=1 Tax=Amycolatopsis sp. NPDC059021 TaxID=3346704 RepID=UPI00366F9BAE